MNDLARYDSCLMHSHRRPFRNIILPAMILAPLLYLHVGCLYVPWFEQSARPRQKDFRPLLGSADSHKLIRPGSITRTQIEAALGKPAYLSVDGTATGYDMRTITAFWVYPLCFAADRANVRSYVVKFTFDPSGELARYDVASNDAFCPWIAQGTAEMQVNIVPIRQLNQSGPRLQMAGIVNYINSTQPASSQP